MSDKSFRQNDLKRVLKAVEAAGVRDARVEVDGPRIVVVFPSGDCREAEPPPKPPENIVL